MATDKWFTVLGPVRAWQDGAELDLGSAQQRAVLATLLLRQGTPVSAEDLIESGLGLARRLGDLNLIASLLSGRAGGAFAHGDPADAARHASESVRLFRQAGDQRLMGKLLGNLGYYELSAGDLGAGRRHLANILRKLGLPSRAAAAAWGTRSGLM